MASWPQGHVTSICIYMMFSEWVQIRDVLFHGVLCCGALEPQSLRPPRYSYREAVSVPRGRCEQATPRPVPTGTSIPQRSLESDSSPAFDIVTRHWIHGPTCRLKRDSHEGYVFMISHWTDNRHTNTLI